MSSLKQRFLSGLLTFVMVFTMIPITNMVNPIEVEATNTTTNSSEVYVMAAGQTGSTQGLKPVLTAIAPFNIEMWHYSGGYWGGSLSRNVHDYEFVNNEAGKGTGDIGSALAEGGLLSTTQSFDYYVGKGSKLEESIINGEDIYIEIDSMSTNKDVNLKTLFNFPVERNEKGNFVFKTDSKGSLIGYDKNGNETNTIAKIVKLSKTTFGADYKITFELPIKLNYYSNQEVFEGEGVSFDLFKNKDNKKLGFRKFIPIPKLGFGSVLFSMFPRGNVGGLIENNGNLAASFWFAPESGIDKNGNKVDFSLFQTNPEAYIDEMPIGSIHPSMIMQTNKPSRGSSGYLYPDHKLQLLQGHTPVDKYYDTGNYRIGLNTLADAGAVGIRFNYNLKLNIYSKPKQKAVGVLVFFKGFDENDKPIYEQIDVQDLSQFLQDLGGELYFIDNTLIVQTDTDTYVGVLNDIVVSNTDLGEVKDIVWENTELPQNRKGNITSNVEMSLGIDNEFSDIFDRIYKAVDNYGNVVKNDPFVIWLEEMFIQFYGKRMSEVLELNENSLYNEVLSAFIVNIRQAYPELFISELAKPYSDSNREYVKVDFNEYVKQENLSTLKNSRILGYSKKGRVSESDSWFEKAVEVYTVYAGQGVKAAAGYIINLAGVSLGNTDTYEAKNHYSGESNDANLGQGGALGFETVSETEDSVIYLRYVLYRQTVQFNKIHVIQEDINTGDRKEIGVDNNKDVLKFLNGGNGFFDVTFNDITEDLLQRGVGEKVEFNGWVVSGENVDLNTEPIPQTGSQRGNTIPNIINAVPTNENVFADWNIVRYVDSSGIGGGREDGGLGFSASLTVPQWRLSTYTNDLTNYSSRPNVWNTALSWLTLKADRGHAGTSLTPSGRYNYNIFNPNEEKAGNTPENQKLHSWLHSKALTRGSYSIYHDNTMNAVQMSGTLNLIKATDDSGITAAKWITSRNNSLTELSRYDIRNSSKPSGIFTTSTYQKDREVLDYGIRNIDTYEHMYSIYSHGYYGCYCYNGYETAGTNYIDAEYNLFATFNRYNQVNTDNRLLVVQPDIKSNNGLTTLKYQDSDVLNVYPEYGILFEDDNDSEYIEWMIGDQVRKIQPVVYQTMEHKVYAKPTSTGNMATDNRARTSLNKVVQGDNTANGKQVLYKGGPVNTTFQMYRDSGADKKGILTVKTFALDIKTNSNGVNVKNEWGNSGYDSKQSHTSLLNAIDNTGKANVSEKLLVDSPVGNSYDRVVDYTGAIKSLTSDKYTKVKYGSGTKGTLLDGGNTVMFEHELVVRGGQVIGVYLMNRSSGNNTITSISDLKNRDVALYNALLNMNLYNEGNAKSQTVLSTFEHKTGNTLTESSYASMLQEARKVIDNNLVTPDNAKVFENEGWYSEDTTVLVVKEYVTNYEVPSISLSDKLSMSVKGLDTPIDKNQFFSVLGKGYTYLKYDLPLTVSNPKGGNFNTNSYFETTSLPNDGFDSFGYQGVDYLVPNVSISDTTRMN